MMSSERLEKQLNLILELDKLKSVLRRSKVKSAKGRQENSAEHSWHVALMAVLLEEHANEPVNISRVIKMLLLHDTVEIDAGDTFVYDVVASQQQEEKEMQAAIRLFSILPDDQGQELMSLWLEFEQAQTADAKFAKALDRTIPILLNVNNQGQSWVEHGIGQSQVIEINQRIGQGSDLLWEKVQTLISESVKNGWLKD